MNTFFQVGEENECCAILEGHGRYVACCAFSRDGQLLASGSNDRTTIIWDLTGGRVDFDTDLVPSCVVQSHLGVDNPEVNILIRLPLKIWEYILSTYIHYIQIIPLSLPSSKLLFNGDRGFKSRRGSVRVPRLIFFI